MGFWSNLVKGDVGEAFNSLYITDDDRAVQDQVNRAQEHLIQERLAQGRYTPEQAAAFLKDVSGNTYEEFFEEYGSPADEFVEGVREQADKIRGVGQSLIGGVTGTFFRLIPWQVWAGLAVAAVIYFWPVIGPVLKRVFKR